jgi:hypothetical protein
MREQDYNPSVHRLALITAAATFPLIFMAQFLGLQHVHLSTQQVGGRDIV